MSYNATVKFQYVNDTEPSFNKHFPEIVDQMTVTIEAPAQDLNVWQYYELFKSFLRSVGFADYSIAEGACRLAFQDGNREDDMQKIMKEYDLQDKQLYTDEEYYALQERVEKLEKYIRTTAQRSSENQYTEEEINAMCDAAEAEEKEQCVEMAEREYEWVKNEECPKPDENGNCPPGTVYINGECAYL